VVDKPILERVERYYSARFDEHGATACGVDWNAERSQELRFEQLLRVLDGQEPFRLNDYGCGYGALARFLSEHGHAFEYVGFDLSEPMLAYARATYGDKSRRFVSQEAELEPAEFTVASGIFNVKFDIDSADWQSYAIETIDKLSALSTRGFAFNMLTIYSDLDRMRDDLYYGDPSFFFDLCKRRHSANVALLHDYGLWEFTVIVRKFER
jgi:SAM-dependent methyltransferase